MLQLQMLKKNGWVKIDKNESGSKISVKEKSIETPEEKLISLLERNQFLKNKLKINLHSNFCYKDQIT